ncbi:uncharacterized protein LOC117289132 isoform X2 [Asterias rubens]|uniref:uncharacterized protein LOC117289132 isoform X2 n=1 Tax=Asterias rubens TaxID=7604 RepID=UPI0014558B14|nr:uncharacterized protein LOC117289132 isoform X2 [Asterias rubens]
MGLMPGLSDSDSAVSVVTGLFPDDVTDGRAGRGGDGLIGSDQSGEKEVDPNNPFSFKEFVRKDKRKAVYYTSKEDSVDQPTASQNEVYVDMGNQTSQVSQGSSQSDGKTSQRRATSSGIPSRSRGKAHRSAQSAINPVPAIPPHGSHPDYDTVATSTSNPVKVTPITATVVDSAAKGAEFVDFIYDYATKDDDQEGGEITIRSNTGTNMSNGPPKPVDRKHGRERARAHTHGHCPRKQKPAAANKAGNTKSQLVVDYMDGTNHSDEQLSPTSLSPSLTVPHFTVNGTEVEESLGPKPGRERARAQSHGHRKKLPKKIPEPPSKETTKSVPEIVHAVAAENVHNLRKGIYKENGPTPVNKSCDFVSKENGENTYEAFPMVNEDAKSIPEGVEDLTAEVIRLRGNNKHLRQELVDAKKAVEKDAKKIEGMEVELRRLREREAEDAKTLETMVHHVEANLKRTTERAVTAETTITKLKSEIKSFKSEINALSSKNKKLEEGTALKELKDKAHSSSIKLATAAKEAEATIKQMAGGVEALKLLAETLACIDRVSEEMPKSFGTAL